MKKIEAQADLIPFRLFFKFVCALPFLSKVERYRNRNRNRNRFKQSFMDV